jgi:hypothetical protein
MGAKTSPGELADALVQSQRELAESMTRLRGELAPGALADRAKASTKARVREATHYEDGAVKPWVIIAGAAAAVLTLVAVVVRLVARKGRHK